MQSFVDSIEEFYSTKFEMELQTVKNLNIFLLSFAFMLIFAGFDTLASVQPIIFDSAKNNASDGYVDGFHGDGYYSLAINYIIFSISNLFALPILSKIGPRPTLILGGLCYALFIAQLFYPNDYLLYGASVIVGLGSALLWVPQGNFLTLNSDEDTITRNSGIFWNMKNFALFIGNIFVFFQFQGLTDIDTNTRLMVCTVQK